MCGSRAGTAARLRQPGPQTVRNALRVAAQIALHHRHGSPAAQLGDVAIAHAQRAQPPGRHAPQVVRDAVRHLGSPTGRVPRPVRVSDGLAAVVVEHERDDAACGLLQRLVCSRCSASTASSSGMALTGNTIDSCAFDVPRLHRVTSPASRSTCDHLSVSTSLGMRHPVQDANTMGAMRCGAGLTAGRIAVAGLPFWRTSRTRFSSSSVKAMVRVFSIFSQLPKCDSCLCRAYPRGLSSE